MMILDGWHSGPRINAKGNKSQMVRSFPGRYRSGIDVALIYECMTQILGKGLQLLSAIGFHDQTLNFVLFLRSLKM